MRSQFSTTSRRNELVNSMDSVNQANNHNQNHVIGFDNIPEPYHVVDNVAAGSASISSAPVTNSPAASTTTTNNQRSISNSRRRHRSRHRDSHCLSSSSSSSSSTNKSSFENQSSVSTIAASPFLSSSPTPYHLKVLSHMIPEIVHSSNIERSLPITIPQQNCQSIDRHKMKCKNHKEHLYSRSVCQKIIQQNHLLVGSPHSPQPQYLNRTNFPNCPSSSESDEEWERRKLQKPIDKVINSDKTFYSDNDEYDEIFQMDLEESTNASGSTTGKTKSRQPNSDDLKPQIFILDSLQNIPDVIEATVFENELFDVIDNNPPTSISTNTTDVQMRELGRRLRKLSVEFEERIQLVNERQPEILPRRPRFSRNFAGRLKFSWFLLKSVAAGLRNYVLNKLISFKQLWDNLYENYREHAA